MLTGGVGNIAGTLFGVMSLGTILLIVSSARSWRGMVGRNYKSVNALSVPDHSECGYVP